MKFEQLAVWQQAVKLSCKLYEITQTLKDYGFKDQITRAGLSIPSNIAEGVERETIKDSIKFLNYAKASCAEVYTQLVVGNRVGLIDDFHFKSLQEDSSRLAKMLGAMIKKRKTF